MWGRLRYLAIYLVSAWLGGCLAIAYGPRVLYQGASGAICGLLAAEAVWIVLNRRYLPGSVLRRARSAIFVNTLLLVAISLVGGVSGWGHGGGALGGALAAVLLHFQRFGPSPWRWLAVPAVAALPALGVSFIQHQRAVNPQWQVTAEAAEQQRRKEAEDRFEKTYLGRIRQATRSAAQVFQEQVGPLLDQHPSRRAAPAVEKALKAIGDSRPPLDRLAGELAADRPSPSPVVEEARLKGQQYLRAWSELLDLAERALRAEGRPAARDEEALKRQIEAVKKLHTEWNEIAG
jgi:hypothetical protein